MKFKSQVKKIINIQLTDEEAKAIVTNVLEYYAIGNTPEYRLGREIVIDFFTKLSESVGLVNHYRKELTDHVAKKEE